MHGTYGFFIVFLRAEISPGVTHDTSVRDFKCFLKIATRWTTLDKTRAVQRNGVDSSYLTVIRVLVMAAARRRNSSRPTRLVNAYAPFTSRHKTVRRDCRTRPKRFPSRLHYAPQFTTAWTAKHSCLCTTR